MASQFKVLGFFQGPDVGLVPQGPLLSPRLGAGREGSSLPERGLGAPRESSASPPAQHLPSASPCLAASCASCGSSPPRASFINYRGRQGGNFSGPASEQILAHFSDFV